MKGICLPKIPDDKTSDETVFLYWANGDVHKYLFMCGVLEVRVKTEPGS